MASLSPLSYALRASTRGARRRLGATLAPRLTEAQLQVLWRARHCAGGKYTARLVGLGLPYKLGAFGAGKIRVAMRGGKR